MATEISRSYDAARRALTVIIEDDFGIQTPHVIYPAADRCPLCAVAYQGKGDGITDVEAQVSWLVDHVDEITSTTIDRLEAAGIDVSVADSRRRERRANKSASSQVGATSTPATDAGTTQGG
jgi:hypothetical protein